MIPWEQLDRASIPGGRGEITLQRRGEELSIRVDRAELMNSRMHGSEEKLAELGCAPIRERKRAAVLIGGLGMGFTLRAALAELAPDATVVVAELVPAVVAWARGPMAELFDGSLDDPRVDVRLADVADLIASGKGDYDAILLVVDNGPVGLSRRENDRLYSMAGLAAARSALTPGGVLAVWSAHPDKGFAARLRQSGFEVDEVNTRARGKRGARHVIWLAVQKQ
jgi:spermidine synthase